MNIAHNIFPQFLEVSSLTDVLTTNCDGTGLHPQEGRADVAAGSLHQHRDRPLPLRPPPAQHLGADPAPPGAGT